MLTAVEGDERRAVLDAHLCDKGVVDVAAQVELDGPPQHGRHGVGGGAQDADGVVDPGPKDAGGHVGWLSEGGAELCEGLGQDDGGDGGLTGEMGPGEAVVLVFGDQGGEQCRGGSPLSPFFVDGDQHLLVGDGAAEPQHGSSIGELLDLAERRSVTPQGRSPVRRTGGEPVQAFGARVEGAADQEP